MLTLIPVSLAQANEFVRQHHRHHKPVAGHKFSIGCAENGRLCAVAIVGRPVSRYSRQRKAACRSERAAAPQRRFRGGERLRRRARG